MLYMWIHTHSPERCLVTQPAKGREMMGGLFQAFEKAGVKVLGTYMAPPTHKSFMIVEVPGEAAFTRLGAEPAFVSWLAWGQSEMIPVVSAERAMASLEARS
jgi:hypothetical protein